MHDKIFTMMKNPTMNMIKNEISKNASSDMLVNPKSHLNKRSLIFNLSKKPAPVQSATEFASFKATHSAAAPILFSAFFLQQKKKFIFISKYGNKCITNVF